MRKHETTARTTEEGCDVHARCSTKHDDVHHNPPMSWWAAARKPFAGKTYRLCPSAHEGEVHEGIDETIKHGGLSRPYSPKVRAIVAEAFAVAERNGLKPRPTL